MQDTISVIRLELVVKEQEIAALKVRVYKLEANYNSLRPIGNRLRRRRQL